MMRKKANNPRRRLVNMVVLAAALNGVEATEEEGSFPSLVFPLMIAFVGREKWVLLANSDDLVFC